MSTSHTFRDPLLLAGKALTILMQVAMAIAAAALIFAMPVVIVMRGHIATELAAEFGPGASEFPLWPVVGVMALALVAVVLIFLFFDRLRRIIGTVGEGDPFAPENARRLNLMAWLLLAVQIIEVPIVGIGLAVANWAEEIGDADVHFEAGLDFSGILMVIVLFILARVFKRGAQMREDLEGTV